MTCTLTYGSIGMNIQHALKSEEDGDLASNCYQRYLNTLRDMFILLNNELTPLNVNSTLQWPISGSTLKNHLRFLSMAQMCTDRAMDQLRPPDISSRANGGQLTSLSRHTSLPSDSKLSINPPSPSPTISSHQLPPKQQPRSLGQTMPRPSQQTVVRGTVSLPATASITNTSERPSTALESPIEEAHRRNRALYGAFQKRIQSGKYNAQQLSQMQLSLQRNLAENLSIANAKEPEFVRHIEEEISKQHLKIEQYSRTHSYLFTNPNLSSLFKLSIQFDFHFLTKDTWYQRLKMSKKGNVAELCFAYLLRLPQHPLTTFIRRHVDECCQALETLLEPGSDTSVLHIGKKFGQDLDSVACIFALLLTENAFNSSPFFVSLSKVVFSGRLTDTLCKVLSLTNRDELTYLQQLMEKPVEEQVQVAGVKNKYLFLEDPLAYKGPMQELCSVLTVASPCEKMAIINNAVTSIVHHIRDRMPEGDKGVGADELLPVLCYLILRSRQPKLLVDCKMMESFVIDDQMEGAEGYTLTTLITAATYCSTRPLS